MKDCEVTKREYGYDNIRFILIFCVVLAHFIEKCPPFTGKIFIYQVIYSFHIPAFLFISGYFASFKQKKIISVWMFGYIVFQTLYIVFDHYLFGTQLQIQYTYPYWLMWYMLAELFYFLLIPFYDMDSWKKRTAILAVSVFIALAAGYDISIGYYMSLSRFFVFQPWFVMGFYYRKLVNEKKSFQTVKKKTKTIAGISVMFGTCISAVIMRVTGITAPMMSGCYPYEEQQYNAGIRLLTMVIAFVWILFLHIVIKPMFHFKIPIITMIGQNTLPVFLLHGFIVKFLDYYYPEILGGPVQIFVITCITLLLLGNVYIGKFFNILFDWSIRPDTKNATRRDKNERL